jgi:alkylation response protein AidB-like acyl-CoA dehydrogenase
MEVFMKYYVDLQDIQFILEHEIHAKTLLDFSRYGDFSEEIFGMIIDQSLRFAENEIAPLNEVGDRNPCQFDGERVTAPEGFHAAYQKFAENGFLAMDVPTTYGGQGLPFTIATVANEFFIGASTAFEMYPGLTRGSAHLIETFGPQELAETFCAKMYGGQWAGTMCLTEPQAGSSLGDIKTEATPQADGTYKIKGSKIFISAGDHDLTENIIHLVLARIPGDPEGSTKGISLFAVPKIKVNSDGSLGESNDVKTVNIEHKMGIKASVTCSLNFGESDNCVGYLVGKRMKGMRQMFQMMNEARLMVGLQGSATAAAAYEHALRYAKERTQGGDTTIDQYPDVKRMLLTQKSYVEGLRALIYNTANYLDHATCEEDEDKKNYFQGLADLLTPVCKVAGSDFGFRVTEQALQTLGGYGYISEYPLEQYMRDIKISSIYEGTTGIQALDFIGRKLTLQDGAVIQNFNAMLMKLITANQDHSELAKEMSELQKSVESVGQVAMKFMEYSSTGKIEMAMLGATPFLYAFGLTAMAYYLLEQAVIAAKLLSEGHDDKKYLSGKIKTAQFFVHQILPEVRAKTWAILSEDRSALDIAI